MPALTFAPKFYGHKTKNTNQGRKQLVRKRKISNFAYQKRKEKERDNLLITSDHEKPEFYGIISFS